MRKRYGTIWVVLLIASSACSSGLSRSKAEAALRREGKIGWTMESLQVHSGLDCVKESSWFDVRRTTEKRPQGHSRWDATLTDEGRKYISHLRDNYGWIDPVFIEPLQTTGEITGVTELTATVAEVSYHWKFEDRPPEELVRFASLCKKEQSNTGFSQWIGGNGKVKFRLYDDGWRLE